MSALDESLKLVEFCIKNDGHQDLETERFELKALATGENWTELYLTACAFLNGNGGIIVVGISEKKNPKDKSKKSYHFTGFNYDNEPNLKQIPEKFTNDLGLKIDLKSHFDYEIRSFLDGKIVIVYVTELSDDQKYAYYKGKAYKRIFTGDHALTVQEIEEYEELKKGIIKHQELSVIEDLNLEIFNIDVLNQYIQRYNRGKKRGETLKANLESAMSFLIRENFVRENKPTLLGMLVCGNYVEKYIQGKCEADCYVIMPDANKLGQSKEVIEDNIVELIQSCFNFVWRNIQINIIYDHSGTAVPEYPQELIRESINNAFAHRNYQTDRFVIIEIRPNESLMIRNPGAFERRQRIHLDTEFGKIRRIIPIQVARNPKLTHLLKIFDYWEGKGRGLTSLIDACLDNQIDVPYYILTDGEIKLFIPNGKVYNQSMQVWLDSFAGYLFKKMGRELNDEEKVMLSFFRKSEMLNRLDCYTILLTKDNNHKEVIAFLEEKELIFKNPASSEIYPIYQVDKILTKTDFSEELKNIFGKEWNFLKPDYQDVLQAIYSHNEFANQSQMVSANSIGTFVYTKNKHKIIDLKDYENFKRKIRNVFNKLENKGFITRKDGKNKGKPDFEINKKFGLENKLFS